MSVAVHFCFFKQKTAYEMRISDWSSDVCSSDLLHHREADLRRLAGLAFQEGARDEAHEVAIAGLVLHQEDELVGRRRGAVARLAGLSGGQLARYLGLAADDGLHAFLLGGLGEVQAREERSDEWGAGNEGGSEGRYGG